MPQIRDTLKQYLGVVPRLRQGPKPPQYLLTNFFRKAQVGPVVTRTDTNNPVTHHLSVPGVIPGLAKAVAEVDDDPKALEKILAANKLRAWNNEDPETTEVIYQPRSKLRTIATAATIVGVAGVTALLGLPDLIKAVSFYTSSTVGLLIFIGTGLAAARIAYVNRHKLKSYHFNSRTGGVLAGQNSINKILKTVILPATAISLGAGLAINGIYTWLELPLGLPYGTIGWKFVFGGALAYKLAPAFFRFVVRLGTKFKNWWKKQPNIEKHFPKRGLRALTITDFLSNISWVFTAALYGQITKVFSGQIAGGLKIFTSHVWDNMFGSMDGSDDFLKTAIPLAGSAILIFLIKGTRKKVLGSPLLQKPIIKGIARWGAAGLGIGALVGLVGAPTMASTLLVYLLTLLYFHSSLLHSLKQQEGTVTLALDRSQVIDWVQSWLPGGSQHPGGATSTTNKPAFNMVDAYISIYAMSVLSQGANRIFRGISGTKNTFDFIQAQIMVRRLVNPVEERMRQIFYNAYVDVEAIMAAANQNSSNSRRAAITASCNAVSLAMQRCAWLIDDEKFEEGPHQGQYKHPEIHGGHPLCLGDLNTAATKMQVPQARDKSGKFTHLEMGEETSYEERLAVHFFDQKSLTPAEKKEIAIMDKALKDHTFSAYGLTDQLQRNDQDKIFNGVYMRDQARILEYLASVHKNHANALFDFEDRETKEIVLDAGPQQESLKTFLVDILEGYCRRASHHLDTFPVSFSRDYMFKDYIAKLAANDFSSEIARDSIGVMTMPVMTPDGMIEPWTIRLNVIKNFGPDYRTKRSIKNVPDKFKDDRFDWEVRSGHDLGMPTPNPFRCLDMRSHFEKYRQLGGRAFIETYPTAEITSAPQLKSFDENGQPAKQKDHLTGWIEEQEFYDLVYKDNGARLRTFADGSQAIVVKIDENFQKLDINNPAARGFIPDPSVVLMVPGTKLHQKIAQRLKAKEKVFDKIKVVKKLLDRIQKADVPHPFGRYPFGGSFSLDPDLAPRWYFMYPTDFFGITDSDQMEWGIGTLDQWFRKAAHYQRFIIRRPRGEKLRFPDYAEPFKAHMLERKGDACLVINEAVSWMMLKVTIKVPKLNKTGEPERNEDDQVVEEEKVLFCPFNEPKSNGTWKDQLWRGIQQGGKVIKHKTKDGRWKIFLTYDLQTVSDQAFHSQFNADPANPQGFAGLPINAFDMPPEMLRYAEQIVSIEIDRGQYDDPGGPYPVHAFIMGRRENNDFFTDQSRTKPLPKRVAQMLTMGYYGHFSQHDADHLRRVGRRLNNFAWTDDGARVHLKLSGSELKHLLFWLPKYFGPKKPLYNEKTGDFTMDLDHYLALCNSFYDECCYITYMPSTEFKEHWVRGSDTLLFYNEHVKKLDEQRMEAMSC
ncbi:hypothetical protein COT42_07230 [Candidatus Saganbacteria bacterium CG08_land_8_20_14_0_20_45_16]|uniref:Uncharacterized protein n=1 Tax=Candidatus Saganbacteria bacterium CG08_land_8_20_14_0_20_45_16 TaxID=2014293 RepID=A0A2H0XUV7_UNCSA|nr:MAG: hypothetical protein COT42_07230 [Candidatus Saganbacteria bacterium CG08_land_8_20_14_0_20_45_16]